MDAGAPSPSRRVRIRGPLAVAVAVVVVALGLGWSTGIVRAPWAADLGGAGSPAELGEALLDALRDRPDDDGSAGAIAAALVELMDPVEREVLVGSGSTGGDEVGPGLVAEVVALARLDELARVLDVLGPALTATSVRVDAGSANGSTTVVLRADDGLGSPVTVSVEVVEHEGRWYLGLGHTALAVLLDRVEPTPELLGTSLVPRGGRTPDEAIDRLFGALEGLDLARALALTHPGGAGAVQHLVPLVLDEAQAALDRLPLRWTVVERSVGVSGASAMREIVIDRLTMSARIGTTTLELELITPDAPLRLSLRRLGEEWFVDPGSTLLDGLLTLIPTEETAPIGIAELQAGVVAALLDTFFTRVPALDGLLVRGAHDGTAVPGSDVDRGIDEGPIEEAADRPSPVERCFELVAVAEAIVCFAAGVAAGVIPIAEVPVELRFPECGAAEAAWAGYATLTDAAFIGLVERVRPCLLEAVADGRLAAEEIPLAFADPDCFEGRNWFSVLDDPDYTDRVIECAGS